MSLKRHIKDVHFKNQNTYVICPQCCKQYASQNSLYSHLNRVHGVKKEDISLQMTGGGGVMERGDSNHGDGKYDAGLDTSHDGSMMRSAGAGQNHDMMVRGGHEHDQGIIVRHSQQEIIVHRSQASGQDNNHDGIMDLAQHSDHSN